MDKKIFGYVSYLTLFIWMSLCGAIFILSDILREADWHDWIIIFTGFLACIVLLLRIIIIENEFLTISTPFIPFIKNKTFRLNDIDLIRLVIYRVGRRGTEISIVTKDKTDVTSFFMSSNELIKVKKILEERNIKVEYLEVK